MRKIINIVLAALLLFCIVLVAIAEENKKVIDVPYINQKSDLEGFVWYGSACGPCSLAMVLAKFQNRTFSKNELIDLFWKTTIQQGENRLASSIKIADYLQKSGFVVEMYGSANWTTIVNGINSNCLIIMSTDLTDWGHIIVVTGYLDNGEKYVVCNDPGGDKTIGYYNDSGKEIIYKYGTYSIGSKWCIVVNPPPQINIPISEPIIENPIPTLTELITTGPDAEINKTIYVSAQQKWTPTGIEIKFADAIEILATGQAMYAQVNGYYGPDGTEINNIYDGFPTKDAPQGALIGKIGENGHIFYVGSYFYLRAIENGQLFLGINDNNVDDNEGGWNVDIIVSNME